MGYFGGALADILRELGSTQTAFAERSTVPTPQLNRYIRGANNAPPEALSKILAAVPEDYHARLVLGYLRDLVPDKFRDLIRIDEASNRIQESPPAPLLPGIDSELDAILRRFAELAARHKEIRDMLKGFLAALGKLPPEASAGADPRS